MSVRDIGAYFGAFSVSPDEKYIAFQIQQADIHSNSYQTGWYIVSIDQPGEFHFVGDGGDVILAGEESPPINGARLQLEAKWSPDSKWIAYRLKRDGGIQLWRSKRDGSHQDQLTFNKANVINFRWDDSGQSIFFEVGDERGAKRTALEKEALGGYFFDERFVPMFGVDPDSPNRELLHSLSTQPSGLWVFDVQKRTERPANDKDHERHVQLTKLLKQDERFGDRSVFSAALTPRSDRLAWLENEAPEVYSGYSPPVRLYAQAVGGTIQRCGVSECYGRISSLSWSEDGAEIYFLRLDGANYRRRSIFAWRPNEQKVRTVLQTFDHLSGCKYALRAYLCLHEAPTSLRKIVRIDVATGKLEVIADPNPEFMNKAFTEVERIEWKEVSGTDAIGHLVYPKGYVEGQRYPLVIVQYRSDGFLRGGVGNEYPIHPLASEGFFVLSFDRPEKHDVAAKISDPWEFERHHWGKKIWERESALSALEAVIEDLVDKALIEPSQVGITGLSDGAETVWYAMIHSEKFAAAAVSGSSWSPSWYYLLNANARKNYLTYAAELPSPASGDLERWRRISPEFHADQINTPILVQVSAQELVGSASAVGALKDAGQPIEAYVFPDEYHLKWQPKHKLAVYNRTIDWFNFWLRNVEDPNPEKAAQYDRWQKLRELRDQKVRPLN